MNGKWFVYLIGCLKLMVVLTSCSSIKYLSADEYLLTKNKIKFENKDEVENIPGLKYELSTLIQQKPNSNFFFIPRERFFFKIANSPDTSRFDQWKLKYLSEPPTIYASNKAISTAQAMENFLMIKGYFNASVKFEENFRKKLVVNTYLIDVNQIFKVDSVIFSSIDERIYGLMLEYANKSFFKKNAILSGIAYEQEKDRITKLLRDNGYAFFNSNYIAPLEADTVGRNGLAKINIKILPPINNKEHLHYKIGKVTIYQDFWPGLDRSEYSDTIINGFIFKTRNQNFLVNPSTLIENNQLKEGSTFSQSLYDQTYNAFNDLNIYRFVRIKLEPRASEPVLDVNIELTPSKKMEMGLDFEVNYTNRSTSAGTGNLIGISLSPSLRHKNIFKGAESMFSSLSTGAEINQNVKGPRLWNTLDIRVQNEFEFPSFTDYLGIWNRIARTFKNNFRANLKANAISRLGLSFNYLHLLDFYKYNLFNAIYGFEIPETGGKRYFVNHLGIDYLQPEINPGFDAILGENTFFRRSFGQQLFVSLIFREFGYAYRSRPNRFGESHYFGFNAEVSGAEIFGINELYNFIANKNEIFKIGQTEFSQFVRIEMDGRYFRQFNQKKSIAIRLNLGIASSFGFSTDVPYVKQFYVGGPNSIRGWAARGLGPGGYRDPLTRSNSNRLLFYQTGDFKLEASAEYRFDLFWRLKGAFFFDAGNIWTLQFDPSRCGSQFIFSSREVTCGGSSYMMDPFYKQIALGSGMGFRFDFTYFLFRLDMGIKLRNPYPSDNELNLRSEKYYWQDFNKFQLRDINLNFALGLPF
jgi:outer membrane protein insertion porin family